MRYMVSFSEKCATKAALYSLKLCGSFDVYILRYEREGCAVWRRLPDAVVLNFERWYQPSERLVYVVDLKREMRAKVAAARKISACHVETRLEFIGDD